MKKKKNLKPNLPKQYVWELEVAGEDKTFSCVVSEDECVTYEDGVEHKHLKVMDHTCEVKLVGTKTPKATKIFTVVFRTEDDKVLTFNVPEEMYDGFEKGQEGILTVVDGELYGFAIEE